MLKFHIAYACTALLALASAACPVWAGSPQTVSLTVEISGLQSYKGKLVLYLWADNQESRRFPDPSRVQYRDEESNGGPCNFPKASICRRTVENLQDLVADFTFVGLPPGSYALFVFHDENSNGNFDTGLLGRPLEGRGFSEVLPEEMSPLANHIRFKRAKFTLNASRGITIGLKYPPRL
jgi:uncharacterized protein (DUF2141 family)